MLSARAKRLGPRKWTAQQDRILIDYFNHPSFQSWRGITSLIPSRTVRQCRERHREYLKCTVSFVSAWSKEECFTLLLGVMTLGMRWTQLRKYLPRKSKAQIKNHWNSKLSKSALNKQVRQQISSQLKEVENAHKNLSQCHYYNYQRNKLLYKMLYKNLIRNELLDVRELISDETEQARDDSPQANQYVWAKTVQLEKKIVAQIKVQEKQFDDETEYVQLLKGNTGSADLMKVEEEYLTKFMRVNDLVELDLNVKKIANMFMV